MSNLFPRKFSFSPQEKDYVQHSYDDNLNNLRNQQDLQLSDKKSQNSLINQKHTINDSDQKVQNLLELSTSLYSPFKSTIQEAMHQDHQQINQQMQSPKFLYQMQQLEQQYAQQHNKIENSKYANNKNTITNNINNTNKVRDGITNDSKIELQKRIQNYKEQIAKFQDKKQNYKEKYTDNTISQKQLSQSTNYIENQDNLLNNSYLDQNSKIQHSQNSQGQRLMSQTQFQSDRYDTIQQQSIDSQSYTQQNEHKYKTRSLSEFRGQQQYEGVNIDQIIKQLKKELITEREQKSFLQKKVEKKERVLMEQQDFTQNLFTIIQSLKMQIESIKDESLKQSQSDSEVIQNLNISLKELNLENQEQKKQIKQMDIQNIKLIMEIKQSLGNKSMNVSNLNDNSPNSQKLQTSKDYFENDLRIYKQKIKDLSVQIETNKIHYEEVITEQKHEIENLKHLKKQLAIELDQTYYKIREKIKQNTKYSLDFDSQNNNIKLSANNLKTYHNCLLLKLLKLDNEEQGCQKISELNKFYKQHSQFQDCVIEMMILCTNGQKLQSQQQTKQPTYKDAWRWIKHVVQDYYICKTKITQLKEQNKYHKLLANKLNEAIQMGLVSEKSLENTLKELQTRQFV